MKKINIKPILSILLIGFTLGFISCKNPLSQDTQGYLSLTVADKAKQIDPEYKLENMKFVLYGNLTGETSSELAEYDDYDSLLDAKIPLESGNWELKLEAFVKIETSIDVPADISYGRFNGIYIDNSYAGKKFTFTTLGTKFSSTTEKTIVSGDNSVTFNLSVENKYGSSNFDSTYYYDTNGYYHNFTTDGWISNNTKGSVNLSINLPSGSNVYAKIDTYLEYAPFGYYNEAGTYVSGSNVLIYSEPLTISSNKINYSKNLPAGTYKLDIQFFLDENYNSSIYRIIEIANIAQDCESSAERTIEKFSDNIHTITYNLTSNSISGDFTDGYVAPGSFAANFNTKLPTALDVTSTTEGYVLEGFYDNADFTGKSYTVLNNIDSNITLYAKWVEGIAVSEETIDDLDLSDILDETTLVYVGEYTSALKDKIDNAGDNINLIFADITNIPSRAFYECETLKSVKLSNAVDTIDSYAFYYCSKLRTLIIPGTVNTIGNEAFCGCSKLNTLYINDLKSYLSINFTDYIFRNSSNDNKVYLNNVLIQNIDIPNTVTEIPSYAFYLWNKLESVKIPESVRKIGNSSFYYCKSLASIEIKEGLEEIGEYAFYDCDSLKIINIPTTLKKVGSYGFYSCDYINKVNIKDFNSYMNIDFNYGSSPFYSSSSAKLYLNDELVTKITIPNTVRDLTNYTINFNKNCITEIILPSRIKSIPPSYFYNFTALESIVIPEGVEEIESNAFEYCSNLKTITIPSTLESISSGALYGCSNLKNIIISDRTAFDSISSSDSTFNSLIASHPEYIINTSIKYTVSFNTGSYGTAPASIRLSQNEIFNKADVVVPTDSSMIFAGWYLDSTYVDEVSDNFRITTNKTLYAKWLPKFTITYVSSQNNQPDSIDVAENTVLTKEHLPTLPSNVENYFFAGWYLGETRITSSTQKSITSNITLVAKWISMNTDADAINDFEAAGSNTAKYTLIELTNTYDEDGNYPSMVYEKNVILTADTTYFVEWIDSYTNSGLLSDLTDCYIHVYNSDDTQIYYRDDGTGSFTTGELGVYTIRIETRSGHSTDKCAYHLYIVQ